MEKIDILDRLNWRYATKAFDIEKKITDELWNEIEQSLILTPSSFGLQPWKFIVIKDQAIKASLLEHSWNQAQVTECSHLVVLTALKNIGEADVTKFIKTTHAKRCPMEGIVPPKYDEILGLEDTRYTTVLACPMGYRSDDDKYAELAKIRYDREVIIEHK